MSNSKLVYSTDESVTTSDDHSTGNRCSPSEQKVRLHLDRKGGGKVVSIVKGLTEPLDILNIIAKELKIIPAILAEELLENHHHVYLITFLRIPLFLLTNHMYRYLK